MQVVGVDYAGRYIDAAIQLQKGQVVEYGSPTKVAQVPRIGGADPEKVTFKQVSILSQCTVCNCQSVPTTSS